MYYTMKRKKKDVIRANAGITNVMKSDTDLAYGILSKDKRSLFEFYHRYKHQLFWLIRTKVNKEEDCEEILQDTFFAFLEALRDFHGKSSIKTYLFSICHHKIIDYYRRKKMKHIVFSQLPQLEALVSPLLQPEEEFDSQVIKEKIRSALASLVPLYREILVYKYLDGLSVEAIAEKLSLTFKSVESRLFRARKAFVAAYGEQ